MGKKAPTSVCIFGAVFMLKQVQTLENDREGALEAKDIEYIHRMRVASRRLRNAMDLFKACLPDKKVKKWRDEIRRITHSLGEARDMDIQIALLNRIYEDQLDPKFKPGYRRLLLRIKQNRTENQKKIIKTIRKLEDKDILQEMHTHLEKLAALAEGTYLFTPALHQQAFNAITDRLDDFLAYQKYLKEPENIEKPENPDKLHAMRIAGKHLRYTLEIYAPVYQGALAPYLDMMKRIQNNLGQIHDNDVWVKWLPKFIEKEQKRIEAYFGNTGPLKRLLPGIEHLQQDRRKARDTGMKTFYDFWQTLKDQHVWQGVRKIIAAPVNIDAALQHLETEEKQETIPLDKTRETEIPETALPASSPADTPANTETSTSSKT